MSSIADLTGRTANENVIRALAKALADARGGNVEAVMIVTASPDGIPDASFGGEVEYMPTINLGIDLAKANVLAQAGQMVAKSTTSIRRPAAAMDS